MLRNERKIRDLALSVIQDDAVASGHKIQFVQIGSNDGSTDDPLSKFIKSGHWEGLIVEPIPEAMDKCRSNYSNTPCLQFFEGAVSDYNGEADFFVGSNDRLASLDLKLASRRSSADEVNRTKVKVRTLESLLGQFDREACDVLVIDAEGHDARILSRLVETKIRPRLIIYESHNLALNEVRETIKILEGLDYTVMSLRSDSIAIRGGLFDTKTQCQIFEYAVEVEVMLEKRIRSLQENSKST